MSDQPSTAININSLNGRDMIVGDNMNIPSARSMFATTRSSTINGTNIINPISKAVFNSLIINAGAICQIVISSGDFGGSFCENSTKKRQIGFACLFHHKFF